MDGCPEPDGHRARCHLDRGRRPWHGWQGHAGVSGCAERPRESPSPWSRSSPDWWPTSLTPSVRTSLVAAWRKTTTDRAATVQGAVRTSDDGLFAGCNAGSFGVQRLQHAQWPHMRSEHDGALLVVAAHRQIELGVPGRRGGNGRAQRGFQNARCSAAISSSTSGTGPTTAIAFWPRSNTSRHGRSSVGFSGCAPVCVSSARSLRP